ncbi:hypothetical protein THAOC_03023 [Thalassiosira oceanica]|uniref:Uncharacterized protein n=1 Tax=Thalassiosira oceanica TaxID=159749 RepID=K0TCX3_THAOC|nr:hypothetical protein THAOC_03023 [Thalassiosira oceanica]|eukprot:EJK75260.1 hypothetical protein THAOC_03023 [Thalassiosira oceanica]
MRRNIAPSSASSPAEDGIANRRPPAASRNEADAKTRFEETVCLGVETLLSNGLSRDDAGAILLAEISNGSAPDENEIFRTMESLGVSLDEARKVATVSKAYHSAQATQSSHGSSTISSIDVLTSRLTLRSRSPSPPPSTSQTAPPSVHTMPMLNFRNSETTGLAKATTSERSAKNCHGPRTTHQTTKATSKKGRGSSRKRGPSEQNAEKGTKRAHRVEESDKEQINLKVNEKMKGFLAGSSEAKTPKAVSLARGKTPESLRGNKRSASLSMEEESPAKRPYRERLNTEESILPSALSDDL